MTIEKFISDNKLEEYNIRKIGKLPNKILSKIFKEYKYIDVIELWYDDEDNPDRNNWIDIEGMGYGWLWCKYRKSEKKQRKIIRRFALQCCPNQDLYSYYVNDIRHYLFWTGDSVIQIRLSNNKLDWW